jgi:hypothetical protein
MKNKEEISDLEICKRKIKAILIEYNCSIETDDYHWCWLRDNDTDETISLEDKL